MKSDNSQSIHDGIVGTPSHTLHLYTSKVGKYGIQKAFLSLLESDEKAVYVTSDNYKLPIKELNSTNIQLEVIKPGEIKTLEDRKDNKLRIIVDAGSISDQEDSEIDERESEINNLVKKHSINCLCTYDVSKLNPKTIKQLTDHHNHLQLTTTDLTILSGDLLDKSKLSGGSIGKMVKSNLETIILALVQKEPRCGTDIIKQIHLEFNILLSPGTIYPLLHSLVEKGLLIMEKCGKAKKYTPAKNAEPRIKHLVDEHIQTRKLLNHYLMHTPTISGGS